MRSSPPSVLPHQIKQSIPHQLPMQSLSPSLSLHTHLRLPESGQFPANPTTIPAKCIRKWKSQVISAVAAPPALKKTTTHSMPPEKAEVFKSLEGWAKQSVLPLLKPVDQCWQPQEFLPDPALSKGSFMEEVAALRARTAELPDDYFVVLVGDMITEEALPTYQTMINTLDGVRDETGASSNPWAVWTRAWTAEENRHGDLLNKYLYLSGRVDMRMVERTVQYLIGSGMVSLILKSDRR